MNLQTVIHSRTEVVWDVVLADVNDALSRVLVLMNVAVSAPGPARVSCSNCTRSAASALTTSAYESTAFILALLERARGIIEVLGLEHAEVDSEVADAQVVVWTQWAMTEGDKAGEEGVGRVLEREDGLFCLLRGYESEADVIGRGGIEGRTVKRMRRLVL